MRYDPSILIARTRAEAFEEAAYWCLYAMVFVTGGILGVLLARITE